MLTAKRAPLYISLCLILCLIAMALFTILVQSRQQTSTLWAERAAELYACSLDTGQRQTERAEIFAQSRSAMLTALQYDPYNTAHWLRLSVIDGHNINSEATSPAMAVDIIRRLGTEAQLRRDYILPSSPLNPVWAPD